MGLFRESKCSRCHRPLAGCICQEIARGHAKEAKAKGLPDPRPHACTKCGRTVRGGVCPGPDC